MLKHTQEQQYKTDLFKEVDKKFWQDIEKEKLLFEINDKKKRKNKNNRVN